MRSRNTIIIMAVMLPLLFMLNLAYGSVSIPLSQVIDVLMGGEAEKSAWTFIILQSRLPEAITATFCGASLAALGLMLQTFFSNPLAGPSVLGISSGASLGVAIVMLALGGTIGASGQMGTGLHLAGSISVVMGAFIGSAIITGLYLVVTNFVRNNLIILILGIMVGYLASSAVTLLNFFATVENVHSYVSWGMGTFSNVSMSQLPLFCILCAAGLAIALLLAKSLNAMLLGERYASTLGINMPMARRMVLLATGLLTAATTAFCGPVSFIGLAVPHIARMITRTSDHRFLMPATMLCGSLIALMCNAICVLPHQLIIPLNAITPVFGAPVIIYIIFRKRR